MKFRSVFLVASFVLFFVVPAFSADYSAWVKSETCWVVKKPSTKAPIVGIILQKASVQLEDVDEHWARLVFAPVRSLDKKGGYIQCNGCYIEKKNVSKLPPGKW